MDHNPDTSRRLTDEQKIQLIDSMRNKGSYEAARERLTATARIIADRVSAAIPGQTWKFTEDPAGRKADREGLSCKELTGDIARRPIADAVIFGTAFSAEDFKVVTNIVREEAAKYGATTESSLFNESAKRDYDVQGNGYEFNLGQIKFATLNITGDCFLLQKVLDLPAGQLPPRTTHLADDLDANPVSTTIVAGVIQGHLPVILPTRRRARDLGHTTAFFGRKRSNAYISVSNTYMFAPCLGVQRSTSMTYCWPARKRRSVPPG